jgi:hypothetical protein
MAEQVAASSELPPATPQRQAEDPELVRLRGEVAKQKQDFEALKQRVSAPPAPAAQPSGQLSPAEMAREFYKDPIGSAAAIAQRVVNDQLQQQGHQGYDTLVQVAKDKARSRDPKLFDKYYLEVEAAVSSTPKQFHQNVTVWENAFNMVRGNHIDEILSERAAAQPPANQAPAVHIREGGGPASPSVRPGQAAEEETLSVDEKRVARKLDLSDEQYLAGKKHLEGQNDPVRDPVGKSSWDAQITFSSKDRRARLRREAQQQRKAS